MAFSEDQKLHKYCDDGNYKKVEQILKEMKKNGIDVSSKLKLKLGVFGYTPLHAAATAGRTHVLRLLNEYGGAVNSKASSGYTPLHLAASGGHVEAVRNLLQYGADINAQDEFGKTPIKTAELGARTSVVRVLKSAGD